MKLVSRRRFVSFSSDFVRATPLSHFTSPWFVLNSTRPIMYIYTHLYVLLFKYGKLISLSILRHLLKLVKLPPTGKSFLLIYILTIWSAL